MHKYKFYYKDYKEHFEIYDDNKTIATYEANFGESLFSLFYIHEATLNSYLSIINHYIYLANIFYERKQSKKTTDNDFPVFSFDNNHIFRFFFDSFIQYQKNELDVAPNKNTWFNYNISKNNLVYTSDEFYSSLNFAKEFFHSAAYSENLPLENTNIFSNPLRINFEKIDEKNTEVLYPQHINDIIKYYIILSLRLFDHSKLYIIKCKRCGRLFANFKSGRNVLYCNYKNISGYSCREEMELSFKDRERTSEQIKADKIYRKYYDYQRRKINKNTINNEQYKIWSVHARSVRDKCREGDISISDFEEWMKLNKDTYSF